MEVLFVYDAEYPWDIRVEKICKTLIKNGYKVHLVCRNRSRRSLEELLDGIHLHRIPFLPQKSGIVNDIFTFPAFFNPIWLYRIYRVVKLENIDLIIVRDLPMALAAICVAKVHRVPIILDMAECYPEFIRLIWKYEPFKFRNIFVRNPFIVDLIEYLSTRLVNCVFVMIEESKNRLVKKGICVDKIAIVSNTPLFKRFQKARNDYDEKIIQNKKKLILLYVGYLDFTRDLPTVFRAIKELAEKIRSITLIVVGNGSAEKDFHWMANKLNIEKHVVFEGWVENRSIPEFIASADICLVPHNKCGHWDNTIPNKLFDYMAAGKVVLVSDAKPMKRIVQQYNCGLVYNANDERSFISQVLRLQDTKVRSDFGANGLKAVKKDLNWGVDSLNMFTALDKVMKKVGKY